MNKKVIWLALVALLFALCFSVQAQESKKVRRIGFLGAIPSINPAFLEALHALSYKEGKNIIIEQRFAQDNLERLPDLAAELVSLKPDVIVAQGTPAAQ